MTEETLFELPPAQEWGPASPTRREEARVLRAGTAATPVGAP